MTAKRDRTLTDPAELEAAAAFKAAFRRSERTQEEIADQVGVTSGAVSHWVNARMAIPAIRAKRLGELVNAAPDAISVEWRTLRREMGVSQPARLDPQMMAESMVAMLKMMDREGVAFDPVASAPMLVDVYEIRAKYPATLNKPELSAFDNFVHNLVKLAGREDGGSRDKGSGEADRKRSRKNA